MATVYTFGLVIYVAAVTFWIVRLLVCLTIKDPKSKITVWLQKSFFSMCFASGKEMAYTTLIYAGAAFIGYLFGFTMTAHGMLVYLSLLTIQWLYVNTEENRRRYDEILLAEELVGAPA
jgi:hypothetical protein